MNDFLKRYRREAGVCLVLALAVWGVFGQSIRFDFINYDDSDYVSAAPMVLRGLTSDGVAYAFTSRLADGWYPLTTMSLMLDASLYGGAPGGYHRTNVLLHLLAVLALFGALRSLTGSVWRSAFVVAVFAIHPLRAESVAWVSARKDVLSGLFFFLTLWAYARYAREASGKWQVARFSRPPSSVLRPLSSGSYWLVLTLFACALMSKPTVVPLPFLLLVLDFWPLRRMAQTPNAKSFWKLVTEKIPLFLLMAVVVAVTPSAEKVALRTDELSFVFRSANAFRSCGVYILQTVYPSGLMLYYRHPGTDISPIEAGGGLAAVLAISVAVFLLRRRNPALLTGWLWYLGLLTPVIGIILAGAQAHADRYTYLPHAGLLIVLVWAVAAAVERVRLPRAIPAAAGAILLAALTVAGAKQVSVWRGSDTIWTHALKHDPANLIGCNNLGIWLMTQNRMEEAGALFDRAIAAHPGYRDALYNQGIVEIARGDLKAAVSYFERAIKTDAQFVSAHQNLGTVLLQSGQAEKAVEAYQRALKLRPGDPGLTALLEQAKSRGRLSGRIAGLIREAAEAEAKGDLSRSAALYRNALKLQPDSISALNNLAWLLSVGPDETVRNGVEAVEIARRACVLTGGNHPGLLDTLAAACAEAGRFDEAVKTAEKAVGLAQAAGDEALASKIAARLELYRQGKPFRQ